MPTRVARTATARRQPATAEECAVRRAEIQKVDGTAPMMQDRRMMPRGRGMLQEHIALGKPPSDEVRTAFSERHRLNECSIAPHEEMRVREQAARRCTPVRCCEARNHEWL